MAKPAYYRSDVFRFTPNTAFLGAETNGAMPEPAVGLIFEAEIGMADGDEKPFTNIHVLVAKPSHENGRGEHFMYADKVENLERLFSAASRVAMRGGHTAMSGRFDAYRNQAQIQHDPDGVNTSEELYENLACSISHPKDGHVEIALIDHSANGAGCVARLGFPLDGAGVTALSAEFERLREFVQTALRNISDEQPEPEAAPSPMPA